MEQGTRLSPEAQHESGAPCVLSPCGGLPATLQLSLHSLASAEDPSCPWICLSEMDRPCPSRLISRLCYPSKMDSASLCPGLSRLDELILGCYLNGGRGHLSKAQGHCFRTTGCPHPVFPGCPKCPKVTRCSLLPELPGDVPTP